VAEDIAQETFIAAYYKLHLFDQQKKFSTWLFKVATNKALNHLKKYSREIHLDEEIFDTFVSTAPSPSRAAVHRELHDAIAALTPKHQAVISLYYWQGLSCKEIASVLGSPEGSVKVWIKRAKNQLRKELA